MTRGRDRRAKRTIRNAERSLRVCRNRIPPRGTDEERAGWQER